MRDVKFFCKRLFVLLTWIFNVDIINLGSGTDVCECSY